MLRLIAATLLAATLTACAGQTTLERNLDLKVSATPVPKNMLGTATEQVFEAKSLNADQKSRLKELYASSSAEHKQLRESLLKHQAVLAHELVNPLADDGEIELLKTRILDIEKKRSGLFLSTLEKAQEILGRKEASDESFYRAFVMNPLQPDPLP